MITLEHLQSINDRLTKRQRLTEGEAEFIAWFIGELNRTIWNKR